MRADLPGLEHAIQGVTANGTPFVALPPAGAVAAQALVVLWHGGDPPRSDEALAAAVPLRHLPAWRVYLDMPLFGRRLPAGGSDELMRLGAQDVVRLRFQPTVAGAVAELPAALADVRARLGIDPALPLGAFGFSQGGAAALLAVADRALPFKAAVTFGAAVDFPLIVDMLGKHFGFRYPWDAESRVVAKGLSATHRADALAASGCALLLAVGERDPYPVRAPNEQLAAAVQAAGGSAEFRLVSDLAHAFVDEPGTGAAPQGPPARAVDELAEPWFRQHLL